MSDPVDRQSIHVELERARGLLHDLAASASPTDLQRRTTGTQWTNEQMLFHMVFGYMIVLRLLWLVRLFGRLPDGYSQRFARTLDAGRRPFHVVNYLGSKYDIETIPEPASGLLACAAGIGLLLRRRRR